MKRVAALACAVLLAGNAFASDIGVVVSSAGVVIAKDIYASGTVGWWASKQITDPAVTTVFFSLPDPAFDAVVVPINQPQYRSDAVLALSDFSGHPKLIRAVLLVILDEINLIRTQLALPTRTVAQMKTAIAAKLNAGTAD